MEIKNNKDKKKEKNELNKIIQKLHPLERQVINYAIKNNKKNVNLKDVGLELNLPDIAVLRSFQWLESKNLGIIKRTYKKYYHKLKEPYDTLVLDYLMNNKDVNIQSIASSLNLNPKEVGGIVGALKKNLLIEFKDKKINILDKERSKKYIKSLNELLSLIKQDLPDDKIKDLNKKIAEDFVKRKIFSKITKENIEFEFNDLDKLTQIDFDLIEHNSTNIIKSGIWKKKNFRSYDINTKTNNTDYYRLHFVTQAIRYIKQIWIELGFEEMDGNYIQSSFWDLDALFVPQDHPARSMQDSFYIDEKFDINDVDERVRKKVKDVHQGKVINTKGWGQWNEEEASKLMLRTHTSVLSAQQLTKQRTGKFFTIGKVFRNETLDWKHLFEFNQVEGIVVDENANFKQLIWYLKQFYKKMGYDKIRIRPAYFPYTEPSLEIEVFNNERNEWVELGGAGIFRPEVTYSLFGKEIPVLAWGLGLARIIIKPFKIKDLRDLYGNDLKRIRESPIVFYR